MFTYFGILKTSSSQEEILASGIETPPNIVRQKPFFGGSYRRADDAPLKTSRLERDLALLDGVNLADTTETAPDRAQQRFVTFFMPPYV